MSRLYGNPIHQCYVYSDFDAAIERLAAGGIGPFWTMRSGGMGIYRGEEHALDMDVGFCYSGDTCFEIIAPRGEQQSAYWEFLTRNPQGGLHHMAYFSDDFEATLAASAAAGKPLEIVQEFRLPGSDEAVEIYCEPKGADNPVLFQFVHHGPFDNWFDSMRKIAAEWDGSEPIRDARASMAAAMPT
ncbi:VOC family protein [Erythrobacter alti]|uniref:VOC family protein n=1 Tax=Erythrobacter alti TaxID=1896145 RepID=UPI0030F3F0C9